MPSPARCCWSPPCISLYQPTHRRHPDNQQDPIRFRNLVTEVGRGSGPGLPKLYGTTMRFLQVLGLESLDQLPEPRSPSENGGRD